jgi:4-amino-4-deoxy-L-arabinose transferase-like glycosyltransferase
LQSQPISLSNEAGSLPVAGRLSPVNIARRVMQGVGGGAAVTLAAMMPWAEFSAAGVTLGPVLIPTLLIASVALVVLTGLGFFAVSVWGLVKRLPGRARAGLLFVAVVSFASLAGFEYGVLRPGSLVAYEYRPAVRLICYTIGIALLACSVPEELGPRFAAIIRRKALAPRQIAALSLAAAAASAVIGAVVLDGMPHIIDGTSYLLQGRTLWSGRLALDPPMHPVLFESELMQFRLTAAGYFSKYPAGWPAVLGLFDALGVAWLANAVLAGLLVTLTYLVVAERGDKRLAGLTAAIVALCPWLWLNGATMMSHLASAVWLWLFLWLLLRGVRTQSRALLTLSGLALGAAALTRPADAAFFALPCACAATGWLIRRPNRWLSRLPLVALGALPGTLVYLWMNAQLNGAGGTSGYGGGHANALFAQAPRSLTHALVWLHQGWVGISSQWFAGAAPAAVLLLCGAVFGRWRLRGQWLVFACAGCLFLCYAVFVFGGRAWVGPRWYVPLIPAVALLIAAGLEAASHAGRMRTPGGVLAAGHLRASLVACVVVFAVALPAKLIELRQQPPHGIDGRVVQTIEQARLTHAVVALPYDGLDPATGQPNYKRGIAGMWAMQTPFEQSDTIYVAAVDGWQHMAAEAWPGRDLYTMNNNAGDYTLTRVQAASTIDPTEVRP